MEHGTGISHPILAFIIGSAAVVDWAVNAAHSVTLTGVLGVLLLILSIGNQGWTMYKNFKSRKRK